MDYRAPRLIEVKMVSKSGLGWFWGSCWPWNRQVWPKYGDRVEFKTDWKPIEISTKFCFQFELVSQVCLVAFGSVLGTLDPSKWVPHPGEVLFFRTSRFSDQNLFWICFLNVFLMVLGRFVGPKIAPKFVQKIDWCFYWFSDRSRKRSGPPREAHPRLDREGRGPRRGVGER